MYCLLMNCSRRLQRTENNHHLNTKLKRKLSLFCNVRLDHVFESPDVDTIYEIPIIFTDRIRGESKLNLSIISEAIFGLIFMFVLRLLLALVSLRF